MYLWINKINLTLNKLNNKCMELLVGLLLGDGHIGKSENKSFITLEQGIKHESYVIYVHKLLTSLGVTLYPIKYYSRSDKRYNNINESVYFKSHNLDALNLLHNMFILNGTKIVPLDIKKWLTPISLAHWICGDGQLVKRGGITLCTDNYSLEEIKILIEALNTNFNADCSIHNKKGKSGTIYHRIYIKKNSFDSIKPLIKEHVHESFVYKLHM